MKPSRRARAAFRDGIMMGQYRTRWALFPASPPPPMAPPRRKPAPRPETVDPAGANLPTEGEP